MLLLCLLSVLFVQNGRATNENGTTTHKQTAFMSASQLAKFGNLSVGDIIEAKLQPLSLPNGTLLELPLVHKAVVVDAVGLQIVQYRFKNENDTTAEEQLAIEGLQRKVTEQGTTDVINGLLKSMFGQVQRDLANVQGLDDLERIRIKCRGPIRNGLMDMMYQYDTANRKVYQDNLVANIRTPCRINNALDARWRPLNATEIVRRATSRIGEEQFKLRSHNCETFANWARYGVNYTEQGERIGAVMEESIRDFESLCERANGDLKAFIREEIARIRRRANEGTAKGAALGCVVGGVGCIIFPPACAATLTVGCGGVAVVNRYLSYKEAASEALRNGEAEMRAKLATYRPELVRILKNLVVELKLEEIIQIDA